MRTRTTLAAIVVAALTVPVGLVAPAYASHGGNAVRTSGGCGNGVRWHLKAKSDDGRIEVEGEIDSNHAGQKWHWVMKHDGSVSAKGKDKTAGRSGSFEVERRMTNLGGKDHFSFKATHGGTTCRGTISY